MPLCTTQRVIFHKTQDSIEITVVKHQDGTSTVTSNQRGLIDTIWQNLPGTIPVYSIIDIKLSKERFAMVFYDFHDGVEFVTRQWDGTSWEAQPKRNHLIAHGWPNSPCIAEILDFDKVRVVQKGVSTIITYDPKTGDELSRAVRKL